MKDGGKAKEASNVFTQQLITHLWSHIAISQNTFISLSNRSADRMSHLYNKNDARILVNRKLPVSHCCPSNS